VRLDQLGEEKTVGTILGTEHDAGEPPYELTVGLGLLKKRSRFETVLEKAVELGAARLVPLRTRYTEAASLRRERSERILRAALKQSGRSRLPRLDAPVPLEDLVEEVRNGGSFDRSFLAHRRRAAADPSLASALSGTDRAPRLLVLIGPEGGFSEEEVARAEAAGATVVALGPRRLRTETAALTAASAVMLAFS